MKRTWIKLFCLLLLLLNHPCFAQEERTAELRHIIVTGPGNDVDIWCQQEDVFLELDESTLIELNNSSTGEKSRFFQKPIILKDKVYRVIVKNNSDTSIQVRTFTIDLIENGSIILNCNYHRCCGKEYNTRFIIFEKDSNNMIETFCDNENGLEEISSKQNGNYKIIGIMNDSISEEVVDSRIRSIEQYFLDHGVAQNQLHHTVDKEYKQNSGFFGSEYFYVWPDPNQELGVIVIYEE